MINIQAEKPNCTISPIRLAKALKDILLGIDASVRGLCDKYNLNGREEEVIMIASQYGRRGSGRGRVTTDNASLYRPPVQVTTDNASLYRPPVQVR